MKKFKFIMDNGTVDWVLASDFKRACLQWECFGRDPRLIMAIECS